MKLNISVGMGAFVIGLSQISYFCLGRLQHDGRVYFEVPWRSKQSWRQRGLPRPVQPWLWMGRLWLWGTNELYMWKTNFHVYMYSQTCFSDHLFINTSCIKSPRFAYPNTMISIKIEPLFSDLLSYVTLFLFYFEESHKQIRSTEGCSKLKKSVDMTSSGKNGLNIRKQVWLYITAKNKTDCWIHSWWKKSKMKLK